MELKKNHNFLSKKVFIKTFGCQMNEYDSNRIYESVSKIGYEKTETYDGANCYIINTCHIRDKAKEKVYHEIGRVKKNFKLKEKPIVIIAGCVAQAENNEMINRVLAANNNTLGGPLDSLLTEIFGIKVFRKLEKIKHILENPKNPGNYDILYEDFKHKNLKEQSQAPSLMAIG